MSVVNNWEEASNALGNASRELISQTGSEEQYVQLINDAARYNIHYDTIHQLAMKTSGHPAVFTKPPVKSTESVVLSRNSANDCLEYMRKLAANEKLIVQEASLHEPTSILSEATIHPSHVQPEWDNSSNYFGIVYRALFETHKRNAMISMYEKRDVFHLHQPAYDVDYCYARARYAADPIHIWPYSMYREPARNIFNPMTSGLSDFTRWNEPAVMAQRNPWIVRNWVLTPPAAMNYPPAYNECMDEVYAGAVGAVEQLQPLPVIVWRVGLARWFQRFHHTYVNQYNMPIPQFNRYYENYMGRYTINPGLFIHDTYYPIKPHYYDKMLLDPNGILWPGAPSYRWMQHYAAFSPGAALVPPHLINSPVARYNNMLFQVSRDMHQYRITAPIDGNYAEGEHAYFYTSWFEGQIAHCMKRDRRQHNMFQPGKLCNDWTYGNVSHVFRHDDIVSTPWDTLNEKSEGHGQIVRSKFPKPSFAMFQIIYGKKVYEDKLVPCYTKNFFLGMKAIKFFDWYRPMGEAKLYTFKVIDN